MRNFLNRYSRPALFALFFGLVFLLYQNIQLKKILSPEKIISGPAKLDPTLWATVNSNSSLSGKKGDYLSFKIQYPRKYVVTTGNMLTDYVTTGGGALPDLIFAKSQLANYEEFQKLLKNGEDCVTVNPSVWSYKPSSIISTKTERINDFTVIKRIVVNPENGKEAMEARINLSEDIIYFFQTCNTEAIKDLEKMLWTFYNRGTYLEKYPQAF